MSSRLNEMENEGLVVIGRPLLNEYDTPEPIEALAATVDAWGTKLSLPLGVVYCGTTINWPDDVQYTPIVIGLVTFSGYGDDDEPVAGDVDAKAMDLARAKAIPAEFWRALADEHGVEVPDTDDVFLAAAGWTWVALDGDDGESVCSVSTEDDGFTVIPEELRGGSYTVRVGYC
ncbi:MAG: hypothetical protein H6711_26620 [Myxococcales bacterium]|nr:hypothetical protein [Myxococcales bacterium]